MGTQITANTSDEDGFSGLYKRLINHLKLEGRSEEEVTKMIRAAVESATLGGKCGQGKQFKPHPMLKERLSLCQLDDAVYCLKKACPFRYDDVNYKLDRFGDGASGTSIDVRRGRLRNLSQ